MFKIATPVSEIFNKKDDAQKVIEYSDCLEIRDERIDFSAGKQEVFHCELQPIHKFTQKEFSYLREVRKLKPGLKLITFHCACNCDTPVLNNEGMFEIGGTRFSVKEMQENARKNFRQIKKIWGQDVKIGIENNNYYPTLAYEDVTNPEFLSQVVNDNQIEFLFDIAHAKITAHNKKTDYLEYIDGLPMDKIIQVHISRYGINSKGHAIDVHQYPTDIEIDEVKKIANSFKPEYLTIEYYKDVNILLKTIKKLRDYDFSK